MIIGILFLSILLAIAILAVVVLIIILTSGIVSGIHGAPYVPIKQKYVKSLLEWARLSSNDIFYDLGCGDARMLITAVKEFRVKKSIGYEVALWPYLEAKFAVLFSGLGDRIVVIRQNFFKTDLSDASFVYIYLFPKLVNLLASKMANELMVGSKIICPSFPIDLICHPEFKLLKTQKFDKITAYLYEKI